MTNPQGPQAVPIAAALTGDFGDKVREETGANPDGPTVGAADADADAVASGAGPDDRRLTDATRDSDGVPIGADDVEEDKRRSGA
ncbi:hypothetical protein [Paractinoplanes brasiliensis]|uniref:Uncharacterized protein n=1 Tax=Paractinoplanes brasiliensis TaxID=52695 RepID=A0A4R6JZI0_9ACTN|nr:hypothetical protein [Actinoplanes brasiliensis]TDO42199.1 hypothetical protein C8E87_5965 [Actinoplanes brasiliensis]GID31934.1 hypothetical protein Abr02nite_69170 [Actinoplanes brasiliensis]